MLWLLTHALAQSPVPVVITEPVYTHALADAKHLKQARYCKLGMAAAPIGYGLGFFAVAQQSALTGDSENANAAYYAAGTSALFASTAAIGLMGSAKASHKALVAQGLPVRRVGPGTIGWSLAGSITAGIALVNLQTAKGEEFRGAGLVGLGLSAGMFALAYRIPLRQMHFNRQARQKAGWWSAEPGRRF